MAPPLGAEIFSRGFCFLPMPEEAVTYYPPRLVAGQPPSVPSSTTPTCTPARQATSRATSARCPGPATGSSSPPAPPAGDARGAAPKPAAAETGPGTTDIKARGGRDAIAKVGELRKLRYKKSGGVFTDWLMDEYWCSCSSVASAGESSQFVLCKMYVFPRAAPTSEAPQESAAYFFTPPPPAAVVMHMQMKMQPAPAPAPAAAPKRPPAAPPMSMSPPCAKRMRRAPVVQPAGGNVSFSMPPPPPQPTCAPPPVVLTPTRSPLAAVGKMLPLAPPHPIRHAMRPHRSPMPLPVPQQPPLPQQVQVPLPTPPAVVRVPLQVPVQSKPRKILDPFEAAAMLRDETEKQTVAAAPHPPPPAAAAAAATPALQDQDEDDWDDLDKALEFEN